jgi:hypothetical protein
MRFHENLDIRRPQFPQSSQSERPRQRSAVPGVNACQMPIERACRASVGNTTAESEGQASRDQRKSSLTIMMRLRGGPDTIERKRGLDPGNRVDEERPCIENVVVGAKTPRSAPSCDGVRFSAHAHKRGHEHGVLLKIGKCDLSDVAGVQIPNPLHQRLDSIIGDPPFDHWTPLMMFQRVPVSFQCKP